MKNILGNVNERDNSYDDSASASVKSSVQNENEEDKADRTQEMKDSNYENSMMQSLSYNTENIEERVSDMANFYKYSKLQSTARKIPVHKFMAQMEKDSEEIKDLLKQGKKDRRILQAKLTKSENDVSTCCSLLINKVFKNLDLFRKDMLEIIQKNQNETALISKEISQLSHDLQQSKRDLLNINSQILNEEHDVGILSYSKEIY